MKLRELLEQLPEYFMDREVRFAFKSLNRYQDPSKATELVIDRIDILGEITITLIEK